MSPAMRAEVIILVVEDNVARDHSCFDQFAFTTIKQDQSVDFAPSPKHPARYLVFPCRSIQVRASTVCCRSCGEGGEGNAGGRQLGSARETHAPFQITSDDAPCQEHSRFRPSGFPRLRISGSCPGFFGVVMLSGSTAHTSAPCGLPAIFKASTPSLPSRRFPLHPGFVGHPPSALTACALPCSVLMGSPPVPGFVATFRLAGCVRRLSPVGKVRIANTLSYCNNFLAIKLKNR